MLKSYKSQKSIYKWNQISFYHLYLSILWQINTFWSPFFFPTASKPSKETKAQEVFMLPISINNHCLYTGHKHRRYQFFYAKNVNIHLTMTHKINIPLKIHVIHIGRDEKRWAIEILDIPSLHYVHFYRHNCQCILFT